ncbi:MAG: signal peptidase I [Candidatus Colwellbacteria bacterium]|nr:signal peptidase I [Candidatus Colwellbacteria bacterium]
MWSVWEVVEVVLVALVTVFLIRTFLVQPFLVSGASMEPNFSSGDYLLVDELTYRFREPSRGEVVVFRYPLDTSVFFIKRIIGMPGEQIVAAAGVMTVYAADETSFTLDEPYLSPSSASDDTFDVTLGSDQYFILGDNRSHSFDSRNWGAIQRDDIIGIARLRILPVTRAMVFTPPAYEPLPAP